MAEETGGQGGDEQPGTTDVRLMERALRERWPMSSDVRVKILKRLTRIVDEDAVHDKKPSDRTVISAARALMTADHLNLEERRLALAEGSGDPDTLTTDAILEADRIRRDRAKRREAALAAGPCN